MSRYFFVDAEESGRDPCNSPEKDAYKTAKKFDS